MMFDPSKSFFIPVWLTKLIPGFCEKTMLYSKLYKRRAALRLAAGGAQRHA
jgi:hypothetical protein